MRSEEEEAAFLMHQMESELVEIKLRKSRSKSTFTRFRNNFLELCKEIYITKHKYREGLHKVETAMDKMTSDITEIISLVKSNARTQEMKAAMGEITTIEQ